MQVKETLNPAARQLRTAARRIVKNRPAAKRAVLGALKLGALAKHTVAQQFPQIIQPRTRSMAIALTANCNLRCVGCRYGRDFMPGRQLSLSMVKELLDDAGRIGVHSVRLYGGEPLLYPHLIDVVRHAIANGIKPWLTTNGILLKKRIDELYEAGLREMTIGLYGTGDEYDSYVQRESRFAELESGLTYIRQRYGMAIDIKLSYLLSRPSCNVASLRNAWEFAHRLQTFFAVDLIHYSLPYFTEGPDQYLQFKPEDEPRIREVTEELLRIQSEYPHLYRESAMSIRAIPDWTLRGANMRVPCDMYDFLWIGADGSVKLCYAAFDLGNLHQRPLREIVYGRAHQDAARNAFQLNCPNCHCERETRMQKHLPSLLKYR